MNKIFFGLLFSITTLQLYAQELSQQSAISLSEAISIALENNHNIKIANNTAEIATNNARIGNAGLLPSINANGSYSGSVEDTELQFPGQPVQTVNGSRSNTLSGSVSASYTLFDGFGNYYQFQSLQKLEEQAGVQARLQIESTLIQVISFYLNVISQKQSLSIAEESIQRSLDRYNRISKRFELGNANRLAVLSAQVDLNADSVAFLQAQNGFLNSKRDLLIQLGEHPDEEILISDDILINSDLILTDLLASSVENNASLVLSRLTAESALLEVKQYKSDRFPVISLNGSYNYLRNEADAGQFEYLQTNGFSGGISISLNLFNGFRQETRIQNAQVELKNNQEVLELSQKTLRRDILNTYETFQTNLFLIEKEELNLETARLNFERSKQQFELGQITNTEFREAQLNVSRVQQNMIRLKVQAKLSEVSLYQLSGQLIEIGS